MKSNEIFNIPDKSNSLEKGAKKQYTTQLDQLKVLKKTNINELKKIVNQIEQIIFIEEKSLNGNLINFFKNNLQIDTKGKSKAKDLIKYIQNKKKIELREKEVSKFIDKIEITKENIKNLNFNAKSNQKIIPIALHEDLEIQNKENFENFYEDEITNNYRTNLLEIIKSKDIVTLEQYNESTKDIPNNNEMDFYKIKGYILFKNILKERIIKGIRTLEKVFDYYNANLFIELFQGECINLAELTHYIFLFNDKNIISDQQMFLMKILNSLKIDKLKKFILFNYQILNENNKMSNLILKKIDTDILNEKIPFANNLILKLNLMKFTTCFNPSLRELTGIDKLKQVLKTILIPVLELILEHEVNLAIDVQLIRLMHTVVMFALSTIPGITLFEGPILYLNKKIYFIIKEMIYPIILKKLKEIPDKLKKVFLSLNKEKSYYQFNEDSGRMLSFDDLEFEFVETQKVFESNVNYDNIEEFNKSFSENLDELREKYVFSIDSDFSLKRMEASIMLNDELLNESMVDSGGDGGGGGGRRRRR